MMFDSALAASQIEQKSNSVCSLDIHFLVHMKYVHGNYQVKQSSWQAVLDQDLLLLVQLGNQLRLE